MNSWTMRVRTGDWNAWGSGKFNELPASTIEPALLQVLLSSVNSITFGRMTVMEVDRSADFLERVVTVTIWLLDPDQEKRR